MTKHSDVIAHWLYTIQQEARNLTKWESDFIVSVNEQFQRTGSVSDKQEEIIERIYAEKTP